MNELIEAFLKLCKELGLEVQTDSDGLYVPGEFVHTCIFVNQVDGDEQEWVRFVARLDGVYYRCDVEDEKDLWTAMMYWLQGDDMDHGGLMQWCTYYYDPKEEEEL